jgi:hypothetical protein
MPTGSNISEKNTVTPELVHGEEASVYGDSGYLGVDKRCLAA